MLIDPAAHGGHRETDLAMLALFGCPHLARVLAAYDDAEALAAFALCCETEGIIPALESSHALAAALEVGRELGPEALLLVNLSGRGDKDINTVADALGVTLS